MQHLETRAAVRQEARYRAALRQEDRFLSTADLTSLNELQSFYLNVSFKITGVLFFSSFKSTSVYCPQFFFYTFLKNISQENARPFKSINQIKR